jgi:hypothetical protein
VGSTRRSLRRPAGARTVLGFFAIAVGMASDVAPNFHPGLIGIWWSIMPCWAVEAAVRERVLLGFGRAAGSALLSQQALSRLVRWGRLRPTRPGYILSRRPIFVSTPWVDCVMISHSALGRLVAAVLVAAPLATIAHASDTPGMSVRADLGPPPRVKSGELDRAPFSGNPLWVIPLQELSSTRDRPLFSPSRRPPPPPVVERPYVPPPPPRVETKPPPEPLMLSLLGTIAGDSSGVALFMENNTQEVVRLRTGESHQGWVLRSVHGREAMLEKGDRKETVTLPKPGDGAAAAAPPTAPVMTGTPATPKALAMPGAPATPGAPGMAAVPDLPAMLWAQGRPSNRH